MGIKQSFFLVLILVISGFLRFFNLMHDSPYFFNPDERNMANAISQFKLPSHPPDIFRCLTSEFISPIFNSKFLIFNEFSNFKFQISNCNLNPHFFSYGQFPLYLAFASDQIIKPISNVLLQLTTNNQPASTRGDESTRGGLTTSFSTAIFWLRFYSALSSTLTVLLVFLISRQLFQPKADQPRADTLLIPLLTATLVAFTPGLIQSAHFGTTESLLTFFFMISIYLSLRYLDKLSNLRFILLTSLTIGLALGSKLTGIFFFVSPFIALTIRILGYCLPCRRDTITQGRRPWEWQAFYWGVIGLFILVGSILIFTLSSPYNLVEPESFRSAVFGYESDVATGKYEAFYTRQFVNTTPIIFQAEKIFPNVLGWPVFILGTFGFLTIVITLIIDLVKNYSKNKKQNGLPLLFILTASFLIYLLPNSFLFAKWTRFTTPILPFFAIFSAYALSKLKNLSVSCYLLSVILLIFPGVAFMSIYTHEDTRVTASKWIYQNIPNNSYILSETANVVDIPLGIPNYQLPISNYQVISFDFYHTDENPTILFTQLLSHLSKADYIFIPSRRIFANYTKLSLKYPLITKYYQLLFSGRLGFEKVKEFSLLSDENAEETFTVFDHPVIRIYKRNKSLKFEDYQRLFAG